MPDNFDPIYTTRTEAIERGIVAALTGSGIAPSDVDIDALADALVTQHLDVNGQAFYMVDVDPDDFWQAVAAHDLGHIGPRDGEDAAPIYDPTDVLSIAPSAPADAVDVAGAWRQAVDAAHALRRSVFGHRDALPLDAWQYDTIGAVLDGDAITAAEAVAAHLTRVVADAANGGAK